MSWITPEDVERKYGAAAVARLVDLDRDAEPDANVLEDAIDSAVGRIRSKLLTRWDRGQVPPAASSGVSKALRRIALKIVWHELHEPFDVKPDGPKEALAVAEAELTDLVRSAGSGDFWESAPAEAVEEMAAISASPSRPKNRRMTIEGLGSLPWPS